MEIFGQIEDGWMSGSNKGARGVFPSNFVEFIEESAPPTAADPPPKDPKNKIPAGGIALPILPVQGGQFQFTVPYSFVFYDYCREAI